MDAPENLKTPSNSRKRKSSSSFDDGVNSASTPYAGQESPAAKCLKNLKSRRIEMDRGLPTIAEETEDQEPARTSDVHLPTEGGEEKIDLPKPEVVDEGDAAMPRVGVRVSGCHSLNSTAVYLDPKRRQMDEEEESNFTKLDDYSILFEKKEPGTFIVLDEAPDEVGDEVTLASIPKLPDEVGDEATLAPIPKLPDEVGDEATLAPVPKLPVEVGDEATLAPVPKLPVEVGDEATLAPVPKLPVEVGDEATLAPVPKLPVEVGDEVTLAPVPKLPDDSPAVVLQKEEVEEKETPGEDSAGRNLHVYKSNDEQENIDNDNSKWEILKRLKTDKERYRAIQTRWPNLQNPHPAVNLSSFNWRQKNGLNPPDLKKNRSTRPRIMNKYNENDGVNAQSPIVLFKNAIKEAELHFKKSEEIESNRLLQDLEQLSYIQHSQLYYNFQYPIGFLKYKHQKEVDDLVQQNRQKIYHLRVAFEQRLKSLKNAITETEKMYNYFYANQPEVSNQTGLVDTEINHWSDVEDMVNLYSYFYN